MEPALLIGKRKKKRNPCPNALFIQWLTEWRDEAARNNWRTQFTYAKALESLKKYPLPLKTGRDCMFLQNFGTKICKMIDDKIAEHTSNCGTDITFSQPLHTATVGVTTAIVGSTSSACILELPHQIPIGLASQATGSIARDGSSRSSLKDRRVECAYVPKPRSVARALLTAFHDDAMSYGGSRRWLTKYELQILAQPFCDASFHEQLPNTRYTAWSSMSTLIAKGMVVKTGRPAKFQLTDEGYQLACDLADSASSTDGSCVYTPATQAIDSHVTACSQNARRTKRKSTEASRSSATKRGGKSGAQPCPAMQHMSPSRKLSAVTVGRRDHSISPSPERIQPADSSIDTDSSVPASPCSQLTRYVRRAVSPSTTTNKDVRSALVREPAGTGSVPLSSAALPFKFVYIDSKGMPVRFRDSAETVVNGGCTTYLIRCPYEGLLLSGVNYNLCFSMKTTDGGDEIFAYLDEAVAPHTASACTEVTTTELGFSTSALPLVRHPSALPAEAECSGRTCGPSALPSTSVAMAERPASQALARPAKPAKKQRTDRESQTHSRSDLRKAPSSAAVVLESVAADFAVGGDPTRASCSHLLGGVPLVSYSRTQELNGERTGSCGSPLFKLLPGEFEIILCVDNREHYGTGCKQALLPELARNGVVFDVRPLSVGDFIWLAREKTTAVPQIRLPGGAPDRSHARELVLDYVIERKRLDDLSSSIIDGRYKEQKRRMKACGLRRPIYLIEQLRSAGHERIKPEVLQQATMNTQVIEEFFVKRTKDLYETVAYLTIMTRHLQSLYSRKTLLAFRHDDLPRCDLNLFDQEIAQLPFDEFNRQSAKSKPRTVRDTFGALLATLPGFSAARAACVLQQYPTLASLMAAYKECAQSVGRTSLLADLKVGGSGRRLGQQLSEMVYRVFYPEAEQST